MFFKKPLILFITILLFLSWGCSTPTCRQVFREEKSFNSREFRVSKEALYQAAEKALCADNFVIEDEDAEKGLISAKRSFQRGRNTIVLSAQCKIINESENRSRIYLTAVETTEVTYVSDRTRYFLFIIPLPGGGGKEAHSIKQKEKTVQDYAFHRNFFKAIEKQLSAS